MNTVDIKQKRARFILISLFVFTILFIAGVGYNAYWRYANLHWDNLLTQMDNVASLKSNALVNWRGNHIANAELIRQNSGFAEHIQEYLADPQDEIASNHIHYWVTSYQQQPESNHVWLLDSIGTTLLMESQPAAPIPQAIRSEIPTILQSHNIMFVDFYENEYSQTTQLALLIPILAPDNNNNLVSIMTIEINPQVFLFPYLQDWPIATPTAQTWLVWHEGQNALGRNARQPWIEERYALLNTNVPAVMAVLGETGSVTGQDGHGTDVIADIHTIPDSPWYLITQIEAASANAPLTTRLREIAGICLAAVGVVATTLFIVWRELYLRGYRQQTRMALALHQAESRWQFALEGAGDGVWDWNAITHKVFYSRQWKTMLGFAEEEIGDTLDEWQTRVHPDDLPYVLAEIEQHFAGQTPVYTSEHRLRAKDGTYRWVLDRGKVVEWDENHKPLRVIGTHADMTLPKQTESLITAQRDLARALSTTHSEAEILSLCLAKVLQVTAMDCGGIYLFDDNEQVLELVFHQGLSEAFVQATSRFTVDSPQMQLIRSRQTIYRHAEAMSQNELYRDEGLYAAAIVPILHQNKVFGCINVASHTLTDIADHTRHALETVALEIGNIVVYQRAAVLLQASEEKYRSLVNSQDAAISTIDANGTFHYINHIGAEPFQLNPEEIVGHHLHDFFPPHIADWQLDRVRQVIKSGQGIRHEYRTILAHNPRWRRVSIQPIHNAAGTVTLAMVNSVDITTQKQLEYDLQEAQARLIEAQELAHMGSWEWNIQKEALTWSEGVYPIFGVDPAHFTPSVDTFENAIYPEDKEAFLQQRTTMLAEKQFAVIDHRIVLPDGQIRYVQERTRLIQNDTGAVIRVIGTVQDITEAKSAESALRASEERYRFIADYVDDIVWQLDTDLRFVYASPATERVLGYLPQEIQGFEVSRLLSETGMAQMYATIQARLSGGSEAHKLTEYKMRHKDGHWIDTEVLSSPVFNASGHLIGFVGVTRDITERKQAETALRLSNQLLHESQAIANLGSWTADLQTGTFDASPEGARLVGWATGVHTTDELLLAIHPDDRTFMRTQWAAAMQGKPYDIEHRVIVGGETRWIHVKARVDFDATGQPLTALGITQDITERKQGEKRLQENEERLRLSLYAAKQGLYDLNVQTGETVVNRQYAEMLGYDPDHFVETNQAWLNRLHPDDGAITAQVYRDYVAGKLPEYRVEFRQRTQQGTWKWILSVGKIVEYDAEGKPLRMLGTHTDITVQKLAEEALRASEEKYRGLMESLDSVVATVDETGRFLYMNDRAAAQLNGTPADFVGKTMHDLFPEPVSTRQLESIRRAIREDRGILSETQTIIQGEYRWNRTIIQPIHDNTGKVIYALINTTDIHRLKQIQQELLELNHTLEERVRERTAEVRDLYDHAPNGYHSVDKKGIFVMMNQTELDWLGYTREEIVGQKSAQDLLAPTSRHIYAETFPRLKQEGLIKDLEFEMVRKDGTLLPVLLNAIAIYDEQGAFLHSRSTILDITERRKTLQVLQESRDELRIANELLEKAAQMKDEFLANMSHELRTPLNAILTFSESLLEEIPGPLNDRQKSWVQNIANSGEHLLSLINDILDLSKVEAGQMELYLEPVSIGDVCQSSLLFVKQIALKKSLKIEYHLENPLDDVDMDQRRLKQILVNLLTNAVKFTQPGGKVSLRVKVDEEVGALYFMVDDTGIGIAAADLERLFQPFTQLDSRLNRQHQGTGLGLALVRRLAELHGGSVTVESELGVGSRFTVALPYQSSKERGRQTAITPPTPTPPSLPLPGGHILLAEDNEVNLVALTDFLKSRHYEVAIARNGREAITIAETIHPSVILMDIQMPELDGLEAIRQLRHMSAFQDTPIVALTALAMPGDRERCLAAGADEYLTKPVSLKVLHGLIQQLIR